MHRNRTFIIQALIVMMAITWGSSVTAQSQDPNCSLFGATLSLGVFPTSGPRTSIDRVGEIRLICANQSDRSRTTQLAVQFYEPDEDKHQPRSVLGAQGLALRLYADAAYTQEIALGGGNQRLLERTVPLAPLQQTEVIIPVYARVTPHPNAPAGQYLLALPFTVSIN